MFLLLSYFVHSGYYLTYYKSSLVTKFKSKTVFKNVNAHSIALGGRALFKFSAEVFNSSADIVYVVWDL